MGDLVHEPCVRSPRNLAWIGAWLAGLAVLRLAFDSAWFVLVLLALPLAPALAEQIRNPRRWLRLDNKCIAWFDGTHERRLRLGEIGRVRFDTRWDLSVRVQVEMKNGSRFFLPYSVIPAPGVLEAAFAERGVSIVRYHFRVF